MSKVLPITHDVPKWGPLERFFDNELHECSGWMWMERWLAPGRDIEVYKHHLTKEHLYLDDFGNHISEEDRARFLKKIHDHQTRDVGADRSEDHSVRLIYRFMDSIKTGTWGDLAEMLPDKDDYFVYLDPKAGSVTHGRGAFIETLRERMAECTLDYESPSHGDRRAAVECAWKGPNGQTLSVFVIEHRGLISSVTEYKVDLPGGELPSWWSCFGQERWLTVIRPDRTDL